MSEAFDPQEARRNQLEGLMQQQLELRHAIETRLAVVGDPMDRAKLSQDAAQAGQRYDQLRAEYESLNSQAGAQTGPNAGQNAQRPDSAPDAKAGKLPGQSVLNAPSGGEASQGPPQTHRGDSVGREETRRDAPTFDEHGQQVGTQYNAAGDIHIHLPGAPPTQAVVGTSPVPPGGRLLGNVPPINRIFTGREKELAALHSALQTGNAALTPVPAALRGMGGVGKTQTAARYVREHRKEYELVCWVNGETLAAYQAQMAGLAPDLDPPVPVQNDQLATFQAVKRWLETQGGWLLVVDNAENLPELRPLLPVHKDGRVLLTTRESVSPKLAESIEVHHMDDAMGATLLLRSAGILAPQQSLTEAEPPIQAEAKAVSADLGGLALALDQAGAYMQDGPMPPGAYLELYRQHRQTLHRDYDETDHQRVEVTFALALAQVKQIPEVGPAAAELALLCAFLAPDSIPDEVFLEGREELGDILALFAADAAAFHRVYTAAGKYALLRRESNPPGLWMHRLAQEVIQDSLPAEQQKAMRERVVLAVNRAFSKADYPAWTLCERLLPHSLLCETYITNDGLSTAEAALLLVWTARYLQHRAQYGEAKRLYREALAIVRQVHGGEHEDVAAVLNNLGLLLHDMGRYDEAASVLEESEGIVAKTIGEDNPNYASSLDNLAGVYYYQHRFDEAALLREQALAITKRHLGAEHPQVAIRLGNLASVYADMERYEEAVSLLEESLAIFRKTIGEHHPNYATHLLILASVYIHWDCCEQAESHLQQALSLREKIFGPEHPEIAHCHFWLGELRYKQGRQKEAADYFRRALEIRERTLGPEHPETIATRSWLAGMSST